MYGGGGAAAGPLLFCARFVLCVCNAFTGDPRQLVSRVAHTPREGRTVPDCLHQFARVFYALPERAEIQPPTKTSRKDKLVFGLYEALQVQRCVVLRYIWTSPGQVILQLPVDRRWKCAWLVVSGSTQRHHDGQNPVAAMKYIVALALSVIR